MNRIKQQYQKYPLKLPLSLNLNLVQKSIPPDYRQDHKK